MVGLKETFLPLITVAFFKYTNYESKIVFLLLLLLKQKRKERDTMCITAMGPFNHKSQISITIINHNHQSQSSISIINLNHQSQSSITIINRNHHNHQSQSSQSQSSISIISIAIINLNHLNRNHQSSQSQSSQSQSSISIAIIISNDFFQTPMSGIEPLPCKHALHQAVSHYQSCRHGFDNSPCLKHIHIHALVL